MTVSIDRAGRIVLPKPLRDQFNLHAGSQLEITTGAAGMELKPVQTKPSMVKTKGWWFHQGVPHDASLTAVEAVRLSRDERIDSLVALAMGKKH